MLTVGSCRQSSVGVSRIRYDKKVARAKMPNENGEGRVHYREWELLERKLLEDSTVFSAFVRPAPSSPLLSPSGPPHPV